MGGLAIGAGFEPACCDQFTGGLARIKASAQFSLQCLREHEVLGDAHLIEAPEARPIADRWRFLPIAKRLQAALADREKYTGVRAYWSDRRAARRTGVLVGTSANEKKLQATYATAQEARQHAEAEFKRLDRGTAQLSYRLAVGRADIYPEQTVAVSGFKPEIDGTDWLVAKATHTIDGSGGFTIMLELEKAG